MQDRGAHHVVLALTGPLPRRHVREALVVAPRLPVGRLVLLAEVTPARLVEAVSRRRPGAERLVAWQPDASVQRIIDGWPRAFTSHRALALGFHADASADGVVGAFLAAEPPR